jgi:hypothetical protein
MPVKRISEKLRLRVIERAQGYCEYCRCPDSVSSSPFAIDHIVPKARVGKTVLRNLAYACQGCNGKKRDKTQAVDPFTGEMVDLFHPRQQRWSDHFVWNEDFTLMIGLTPTGRATLVALDLNRAGVVNLRKLMLNSNQHPLEE